jgi:hypothetical protein
MLIYPARVIFVERLQKTNPELASDDLVCTLLCSASSGARRHVDLVAHSICNLTTEFRGRR